MADSLSSLTAMKHQAFWYDSLFLLIIFAVFATKHGCNCIDSTTEINKNSDRTSRTALVDIFQKYGNNGTLTFEAFEHLLYSLGLGNIAHINHGVHVHRKNGTVHFEELHPDHEHSEESNLEDVTKLQETEEQFHRHDDIKERSDVQLGTTNKCMKPEELLGKTHLASRNNLTEQDFLELCPLLVLQLDMRTCNKKQSYGGDNLVAHDDHGSNESFSGYSHSASVWGFSLLACVIISAVGLVAVAIIPIMHKVIYNHMLQFLVALAVGSLTGDALLHLLPHALISHQEHHSNTDSNHGSHDRHTVWCGLTALGGIYLFFLVERLVGMCSERKRTRKEQRLQKLKECEASGGDASSALHMMNSSMQPVMATGVPHGQGNQNVGNKLSRHADPATSCEEILMMVHTNKDVRKFADDAHDELHQHCDPAVKGNTWSHGGSSSIGGHNHSHSVSGSVASVAWMVIVGDGFHNFADGLAIGSAFASSLVGGLSTSVAVFCHELPHELGDFAMLLNAGMSAKQALVYNCVSSLLCLFGMVIGVLVGNVAAATTWIFALIAGLFLYIALVDMLPEMTKMDPKKGEHPLLHFALQNSGMLVGASVMLIIALFEDQLQDSLST